MERANASKRILGDIDIRSSAKSVHKDRTIFPFLKLPAELRNRIYEYCFDITYEKFQGDAYSAKTPPKRRRPRGPIKPNFDDVPYLGTVQSCAQIRSEFYAWWRRAHVISLVALDSYLTAFYPLTMKMTPTRFNSYTTSVERLTIHVNGEESSNIIRLVKHRARFPNIQVLFSHSYVLEPEHEFEYGHQKRERILYTLVNNQNSKWMRWIRGNMVTGIYVFDDLSRLKTTVIVKERIAPLWMRPSLCRPRPQGFLSSIGLGKLGRFGVDFRIDYS